MSERHTIRRETTEQLNTRVYGRWFEFYEGFKREEANVGHVKKAQSTLQYQKYGSPT